MLRVRSLLALAVALAACTAETASPPGPGGVSESPPRTGGTLRVLLSEDVDALDPQRAGQPPAWGLLRAMHRGLMAFPAKPGAEGSRPVPDLAESAPTVSPDGLRYEFKLRDGPAFGAPVSRPVRAGDVKAGLERAISAGSPIAGYLRVIAGAEAFAARRATGVSGVTTPDDRTVVIQLARPVNDLLWLLAVPAASAVPPGLPPVTPPDKIAASGPYRLDDGGYVAERSIKLVRNLAWNKDSDPVRAAWVDGISVEVGVAPDEIQKRIFAGEADLSGDAGASGPAPAERLVRAPNGCLRYLFMNTRVAPFKSRPLRAAVAAAIAREPIVASYGGGAVVAGTILPPTVDGHDPGRSAPEPDAAAARAGIAAAGQRNGFATQLVVGSQAIDQAHAAAVRSALGAAGVRVAVRTIPIANLHEDHYEVPAARVPMGIATWCADWPGLGGRGALTPLLDGRTIVTRGNTNYSGLSDPRLHPLLDAATVERNPEAAAGRWRSADLLAQALSAVVPLAHLTEASVLGPDVRGFVAHPYFARGDLTAVWLARS